MTPNAFPSIESAAHRPLMGNAPRVALSGSRVTPDTKKAIEQWAKRIGSAGLTLDRLVAHAKRTGFSPSSASSITKSKHHEPNR